MWFLPSLAVATAKHGSAGGGGVLLIVVALAAVVVYIVSLRLHPHTRCRSCRRTPGRSWGGVFKYSYRPCRSCGGKGQKDRLGVRMMAGRDR